MAKYTVFIDCVTTKTYEIEAESPDKACEIAEQMIQEHDFFDEYRKDCEIIEANIDFSHANKNPLIYEDFLKAKKNLQDLNGDHDL